MPYDTKWGALLSFVQAGVIQIKTSLCGPKIRLLSECQITDDYLQIRQSYSVFNLSTKRVQLCSSDSKQTFIPSHKCKSLSKRHLIAHYYLGALFSVEAIVKDKSFCESQTAILLLNLHILLRQAWLQIQRDRKRNKQIQKQISFTKLLYLNNPRLSLALAVSLSNIAQ